MGLLENRFFGIWWDDAGIGVKDLSLRKVSGCFSDSVSIDCVAFQEICGEKKTQKTGKVPN